MGRQVELREVREGRFVRHVVTLDGREVGSVYATMNGWHALRPEEAGTLRTLPTRHDAVLWLVSRN